MIELKVALFQHNPIEDKHPLAITQSRSIVCPEPWYTHAVPILYEFFYEENFHFKAKSHKTHRRWDLIKTHSTKTHVNDQNREPIQTMFSGCQRPQFNSINQSIYHIHMYNLRKCSSIRTAMTIYSIHQNENEILNWIGIHWNWIIPNGSISK